MRSAVAWGAVLSMYAMASAGAQLPPRVSYQLHCMGCHGAHGASDPARVPAIGQTFVELASTQAGRNYLERVPGIATAPLSDKDLAVLLNWLLGSLDASADGHTFSVAEVARVRRRPLADVARARERALQGLWPEAPQP